MTTFSTALPALPRRVHFRNTVFSHGWCALEPFRLEQEPLALSFVVPVRLSRTVLCSFKGSRTGITASGTAEHEGKLSPSDILGIESAIRTVFNTDLDLRPFHRRIADDPQHAWMASVNAGRFLRGVTLFEDIVKTLLTTNCSWSLTEIMTRKLIGETGRTSSHGWTAFPEPESIADCTEDFLRTRCSLGYRAPYVLELARRWSHGDLDKEALSDPALPAAETYRLLRSIKGVGDYAAGTLLRMMGRHDYLALDSWCRSKYSEIHCQGAAVADSEIAKRYAPYDEWKGLVMWLELTRHWYAEKFRF